MAVLLIIRHLPSSAIYVFIVIVGDRFGWGARFRRLVPIDPSAVSLTGLCQVAPARCERLRGFAWRARKRVRWLA